MTATTHTPVDRGRREQQLTAALGRLDSPRVAWSLMALATIAAFAVLYHLTRGTSFWADEWLWITGRRANTVGTFLSPFNGHLSLVPIVIYRAMFALFGIRHYGPYRAMAIAGHLTCALLVFAYVRPRLGGLIALSAGVLILFLGPGWQDMLWGFQVAWSVAVAAGIAAFLLLDRRERRSDIAACILIGISLASTSVGIAIALGLALDVALIRRRWSDAWIVAVPVVLYAIVAAKYHSSDVMASQIVTVPSYVWQSAATALSGLAGLSGLTPVNTSGTTLEFGVPLATVLLAAICWLAYRRRLPLRAVSLLVVLLAYWALIALDRVYFADPGTSRYVYVSCIFALLLVVELARGVKPSQAGVGAVVCITAAAVLSNVGILRNGAAFLRSQGAGTDADLAALNLVRGTLPVGYVPTSLPLSIFNPFTAESYFAAQRVLGSPAYTTAQLATAQASGRATADSELVHAAEITASAPRSGLRTGGGPPRGEAAASGATSVRGSCLSFAPIRVTAPGVQPALTLPVPPTGLRLQASQSQVILSVRRFGGSFAPLITLAQGRPADVAVRLDAAAAPWYLQIATAGPIRICTLTPA